MSDILFGKWGKWVSKKNYIASIDLDEIHARKLYFYQGDVFTFELNYLQYINNYPIVSSKLHIGNETQFCSGEKIC